MKKLILIILGLCAFSFQSIYAQSGGKIVGQVFDAESGEPLAGCNILVEGTAMGVATQFDP